MNDIEKPDRVAAYRRAATIREGVQGFAEAKIAIGEAFEAHDWITLGYTTWEEYCKKEIGNRLKLPRADRDLAIQAFSELGMSVREIAESLDVAKSTVQDALKPPAPRLSGSGQDDQLSAPSPELKEPQVKDPLSEFPAVEQALKEFHDNQTSPGTAVPVDGEEDTAGIRGPAVSSEPPKLQDHPEGKPGDAVEPPSNGADDLDDEAGKEEGPSPEASSVPVDEPERAGDAGVLPPPAPDLVKDEDDPERVEHEMRTRMSQRFCEAIVTLSQGATSRDPIQWLEDVYLPGAYKMQGLPGVNGCFEPEALRLLAARIHMVADHLDETGTKLP